MVYVVLLFVDIYFWNRNTKNAKKVGVIVWCTRFWGADNFSRALPFFRGKRDGFHPTVTVRSSLSCTWPGGFTTAALVLRLAGLFIWRLSIRCGDTAGNWLPVLCGSSAATGSVWRGRFQTNPSYEGLSKNLSWCTFFPWLLRMIHSCPPIFWNLPPQTSISSISSISSSQVTRAPLLGGLLPHPPGGPRCGLAQRPQRRLCRGAGLAAFAEALRRKNRRLLEDLAEQCPAGGWDGGMGSLAIL